MKKTMLIMRGLPGSGKSTYVDRLTKKISNIFKIKVVKCSADNYFIDNNGNYKFDVKKLSIAHLECELLAIASIQNEVDLIIIDNTNTTNSEVNKYNNLGTRYGYRVIQKVIGKTDSESVMLYFNRCRHGAPLEVIQKMAKRLEESLRLVNE